MTTKIFRLPADGVDLKLPLDEAALGATGYIYARGFRNAFDMAFAPNGDLFAIDNGPDADFPDELNWIRADLNYGFPWRFGAQDNPQQFPDYSPKTDPYISQGAGFYAVDNKFYHNDPNYPKARGAFTDPVLNFGWT